ncbi:hypothetical protein P8452_55504 [Trifolium repens]|nr:hypothetical protein P8452_55504 [Trifolium repens]
MVYKTFINLHLSPSFGRHFSQKNGSDQTEQVQYFSSSKNSLSSHESDCLANQEIESTWQKEGTQLSECRKSQAEGIILNVFSTKCY